MSTQVEKRADIPDAPLYVLANDSFMSGWGEAEGKINTVVFPCDNLTEAAIVADNLIRRGEMKRVRSAVHKPRMRPGVLYSIMDKTDAPSYYQQ